MKRRVKDASTRKKLRKLYQLAQGIESEQQLDLMLKADDRLKDNPILLFAVKRQILALNPAIQRNA